MSFDTVTVKSNIFARTFYKSSFRYWRFNPCMKDDDISIRRILSVRWTSIAVCALNSLSNIQSIKDNLDYAVCLGDLIFNRSCHMCYCRSYHPSIYRSAYPPSARSVLLYLSCGIVLLNDLNMLYDETVVGLVKCIITEFSLHDGDNKLHIAQLLPDI